MSAHRRTFRHLSLILAPVLLIASFVLSLSPFGAGASSHREAPLIAKDPAVDNTDVYAFVSPDKPDTVTLISNWIPFEEPGGGPNFYHFDDLARYYIKVDSDGDTLEDVSYEWTFTTEIVNPNTFLYNTGPIDSPTSAAFNYTQHYTVTEILGSGPTATRNVLLSNALMPPDNIGPRSTPTYDALAAQFIHTLPGGVKEFTGQRDDPFYVDVNSIFDLLGLRPFNSLHTIPLPNSPGLDSTAGYNVHATIIQVPIDELAPDCSSAADDKRCVIGVWSTAERPTITTRTPGGESGNNLYVQVSRLGNPLVNEVVMDLSLKDVFNAVPPSVDRTVPAVVDRVNNPEVAALIPVLYPAVTQVPANPRTDLFTIFLTGIPGVTEQQNSMATPSEQLRLNVAIAPTAGVCAGKRMGAIDGDLAGFPNGRRLEDDVTDIALRAVAGGYGPVLNDLLGLPNLSPNNLLGDGVDKNDKPCLSSFPYAPTPHSGYNRQHANITTILLPIAAKGRPS